MTQSGVSDSSPSQVNWRGFLAAWLGWCFDGLDGFLYTLVAMPFVTELLGPGVPKAEVISKAALIQGVFMFGWALGGAFFGRVGDRLGRCRTLNLTILTYAIFTGMAFFSQTWWHLMIFRFLAALGIGGEWAAGSSLVAETVPARFRAMTSAVLQSGYMCGMLLAAFGVRFITGHGVMENLAGQTVPHRYVFLIGVLPAFVTLWIRKAVPEPEQWASEREGQDMPKVGDLFKGEVRAITIKVLAMAAICLTTVWSFLYFSNPIVRNLPEVKKLGSADVEEILFVTTTAWVLVNIVANFAVSWFANKVGYRIAMAVCLFLAFGVYFFGYRELHDLQTTRLILSASAFFALGIFALFPMYIPPLFPTLLRTTGSGFCYNAGRVVAGLGTIYGGQLVAKDTPNLGIWWTSFLYIPGILLALTMPLHKDTQTSS